MEHERTIPSTESSTTKVHLNAFFGDWNHWPIPMKLYKQLIATMNTAPEASGIPMDMNNHSNICRCGCIPKGIPSLFEMAEKRKQYLQVQREKQQQQEKADQQKSTIA